MKVITAKQLKKTYPTKPPVEALKDVSIDIYEGETVALLGPNGAGKTTFLRIITGILLPDSGEVTIFNCNPIKFPARAARFFRFLPETPFLLRDNSLWENARFWFEYWMENFPRDNLYEIFTRFNLINRAQEPLSRYSRGMLQKAALSFMLATQAPVIILDEPTLGLDVVSVKEVVNMINQLKETQKTLLIASHAMTFVEKVADRIAIFNDGKILEVEDINYFKSRHSRPKYVISYTHNENGEIITETFTDSEEMNLRLKQLISNNIKIVEATKYTDSLEEIVQRTLASGKG